MSESKNFPHYMHLWLKRLHPSLASTYLAWFSLVNIAIVFLLGRLLSQIIRISLAYSPILGGALSAIAEIFWLWIMTVGAFGHWWGFPKLKRRKKEEEKGIVYAETEGVF